MPKLGLTMKTGTVVRWFKEEGDTLRLKEPVLEIETEKLSYQVESPADGVLLRKLAVVGEKYPIAFALGYVGQHGELVPAAIGGAEIDIPEAWATAPAPLEGNPIPDTGGRIFISPVAKKLADALSLDYKRIKGTGPNGRIVKADVQAFADRRGAAIPAAAVDAEPDDTVLPYAGMRRAIGQRMQAAWTTIPMVTHHVTVDAGALLELRVLLNRGVTEKREMVTVNDLILALTAAALVRTPIVNSSLSGDTIVLHRRVHLGMATALDNGLIVPVIRNADRKNLLDISREAKDLIARARSGGLTPDEIRGSTFTVTNLGSYGSVDFFTPIINPPEAAILGVGRIADAAAPVDGEVKIRPMLGLSFTYDHRIIDGAVAAGFIKTLMQLMENPARTILERGALS
jgi:pyruvate dehydrogenase E2 component (dihydrolipoamide acetyltransferase)